MRHLIIRNLGPLTEADVNLSRINIVVGPQSAGKSCLLKTACYCAWVEKRIQLSQNPEQFGEDGYFEQRVVQFHKLDGYVSEDTSVKYENDAMKFSYTWKTRTFEFEWKEEGRWNYVCPKISYIPAERNLVAAIPNWFEVNLNDDNIRNFMTDWETARSLVSDGLPILNLGVTYRYDKNNRKDKVVLTNGPMLAFTNTSSGLQSLIPLMVHLNFMYEMRFRHNLLKSIFRVQEELVLYSIVHEKLSLDEINKGKDLFHLHDRDEVCRRIYDNFISMRISEVFLEEPEQNLFPPTQGLLVYKLMDWARGEHGGLLFVATHSPYVVTSFIENGIEDVTLFLTKENEGGRYRVCTASKEDVQQIYDYSIDVFHNIEGIG